MRFVWGVLFSVVVAVASVLIIIMSGVINIGADKAHSPVIYKLLETARMRSIARASKDIVVPNLEDTAMISAGGADYKDMCASCHLSPGVASTDLSAGLYPKPPNFTDKEVVEQYQTDTGAQQGFWAIKHGIMASGMPAWGATHDDDRMWAMIAFIRSLPRLNESQYTMLTTRFDDDMLDMTFDNDDQMQH